MKGKRKMSEKDVLSWASHAEFETSDPWHSIRARLSDPEEEDNVKIKQRPTGKTRRLVLATNLVLLIIVGILAAGMSGLIKLPFWNQGRSLAPYTFNQPTTGFAAIAAGAQHMVALRQDGTVIAVGDNRYGQCDVSTWTNIISIFANDYQTIGISKDGTILAVGKDEGTVNGKQVHPDHLNVSSWKDIYKVAAGTVHTVGLRTDDTVIGTGDNTMQQIDTRDWVDIVDIAAGSFHTLGLKKDGTVVGSGFGFDPLVINEWTDIVMVRAAYLWSIGLRADGTVVVDGTIGSGREHDIYVEDVATWQDIGMISAGPSTIAGLKKDGTVVIEIGSEEVDVSSWPKMVNIAAGMYYVLALDEQGDVYIAGPNAASLMKDFNKLKEDIGSPTLSPTPNISPTTTSTTIPVIKTKPTPVPHQPTNPKSPWDISRDFLLERDSSVQFVPNSSASEKILLPTSFDVVIGDVEVGELLRQRNELSKQNGLDFSQYMGQELEMCTVQIDGSTGGIPVVLLVTDTEVVGYWIDAMDSTNSMGDFHVLLNSLMARLNEKTELYMTSGESILYPYQLRIYRYINGQTEQWDRINPSDLPSDLSTMYLAGDAEIVRAPGRVTGEESYTLYDHQFAIVYEDSRFFRMPTTSGEYTLCLEMSWGTDNHYETFQYYFKIQKP